MIHETRKTMPAMDAGGFSRCEDRVRRSFRRAPRGATALSARGGSRERSFRRRRAARITRSAPSVFHKSRGQVWQVLPRLHGLWLLFVVFCLAWLALSEALWSFFLASGVVLAWRGSHGRANGSGAELLEQSEDLQYR